MDHPYAVTGLDRAVVERLHPAVTRWNRLEGRPRTHHFDRALRAEVRDALWMLSRQWQMGEFEGDDAGSPVLARACVDLKAIDSYQSPGGPPLPLAPDGVLEATVERRPVPLRAGDQYLALDLRLAAGRRWMRLLERELAAGRLSADYRGAYLARYAVAVPDPDAPAGALVCAHADAWQQAACAAERAMDGVALLEHLEGPGSAAADGVGAAAADEAALDGLAGRLRSWFAGLVDQPGPGDDGWIAPRLEYSFTVSGTGDDVVLRADGYHHGHLDWWAFERGEPEATEPAPDAAAGVDRRVQAFVPTAVVFAGMPDTRWWAFEDRRTNFGQVAADTTDLGTLLLMEFALVFANDWFVLPWTLPVGQVAEVRGIAVTTVFDERLWVTPVPERQPSEGWERWAMFTLTPAGGAAPRPELVLLPTVAKVQEGAPLEEVGLARDEMANLVWGVERRIPLPNGWSRAGGEAAHEYRRHLQRLAGDGPAGAAPPAAPLRYRVMNRVPEQWIPFIPVHVDGSSRETQLQRAALPRFLDGDPGPPEKVRPRTPLLRHNLPRAYYVYEEEVPRAGVVVRQGYQRARGPDGSVVVWYGARKSTGRGEGSSGLAFDQLVDVPTPRPEP